MIRRDEVIRAVRALSGRELRLEKWTGATGSTRWVVEEQFEAVGMTVRRWCENEAAASAVFERRAREIGVLVSRGMAA